MSYMTIVEEALAKMVVLKMMSSQAYNEVYEKKKDEKKQRKLQGKHQKVA